MKLRLISFRLCPFVKKAELTLRFKGVKYDIEYIDLAKPPEWFLHMSPLKKVPVLLAGNHVIFESSVICEYLEEAFPEKLHPNDQILRAINRSWIEFGNSCLWDSFYITIRKEKKEFYKSVDNLHAKFDYLENNLGVPFFNGDQISLVDISFSPLFQFLTYINELESEIFINERHPKIIKWKNRLLELNEVKEVYSSDSKEIHFEQFWKRQGYLSRFLDADEYDIGVTPGIY
jgi:glutathione S-transferase